MFDDRYRDRRPERPRSEPEIIPPERPGARRHVWYSADGERGVHHVFVAQPGPFTLFLILALAGLVTAGILILVVGAVLIWLPLAVLAASALLLSVSLRRYWWRLRNWIENR